VDNYDVIRGGLGGPARPAASLAPQTAGPGGARRRPSRPTSTSGSPRDAVQAAGAAGCVDNKRSFPPSPRFPPRPAIGPMIRHGLAVAHADAGAATPAQPARSGGLAMPCAVAGVGEQRRWRQGRRAKVRGHTRAATDSFPDAAAGRRDRAAVSRGADDDHLAAVPGTGTSTSAGRRRLC